MEIKATPENGDRILFCPHAEEEDTNSWHWWFLDDFLFKRPDGSEGRAKWYSECDECYSHRSAKNIEDLNIGGDGVWRGGDIDIKVPAEKLH